jgi:hypothetical protein
MFISEIIINQNIKLLEKFYSDKIDMCYSLYKLFQSESNDFIIPVIDLYEWDYIHEQIYYVTYLIEVLQETHIPNTSQVIIALDDLLNWFNK